MRAWVKGSLILAVGIVAVIVTLWSGTRSLVAQSSIPYKAPRAADGRPDLNGFWQALNSANWDIEAHGAEAPPEPFAELVGAYLAQAPGLGVVEGGTIPYKPEALAKRQLNFETRLTVDVLNQNDTGDPEAKCFLAAPPRATYTPMPFQIVQSRDKIFMGYQFNLTPRLIHLNPDLIDENVLYGVDTWMGQSRGRWEGETLVAEVTNFSGNPWLDRAGNYFSSAATVTERWTAISPYHLWYEATIDDPDVFTRPWKLSMPLYRRIDENMELLEFSCITFVESFMYGSIVPPDWR